MQVQSTVLQAEKPDFVAFSGDQVSGFAWDGQPGWFEAAWRQLIAPVHAAGPPYASVLGERRGTAGTPRMCTHAPRCLPAQPPALRSLSCLQPLALRAGNHDGEADLRRSQATALDVSTGGNLSLTQAGPRYLTGAGNYWLDVYDAAGSRVAARIWMLDSGNRGCDELPDGW
jgi:pre-mRNA-splicing factor SYF1